MLDAGVEDAGGVDELCIEPLEAAVLGDEDAGVEEELCVEPLGAAVLELEAGAEDDELAAGAGDEAVPAVFDGE